MTADVNLLPKYTRQEEIANATTHYVGALFGIGTLITFIILGVMKGYSFVHMIPFYIYSLFMILMFFNSGFYHSRPFNSKSRAIARIIDHSDIYVFCAATYFPICMYGVTNQAASIAMLSIEVGFAILGVTLSVIPNNSRIMKNTTFAIYIIQGWLIMFFYFFNIGIPFNVFLFILIGGIAYSVGAIMYGIGHYKRWSHTWFHAFVLVAAVLQFVGVLFLL
ncbi:MAG: hemolysin III family protein [Bacilli bacterium]|nr:hemolysin III family protein [Bacilli bacterium]